MLKDQFLGSRKPTPHPTPPGKKTIKKDRKNKKKLTSKYIIVKV